MFSSQNLPVNSPVVFDLALVEPVRRTPDEVQLEHELIELPPSILYGTISIHDITRE